MKAIQSGNATDTNSFLQNVVGAPAGQQIPAEKATAAADVLYGLGGRIPAGSFAAQGAGYGAAAAAYPLQAGQQGQFLAAQELAKGAEERARYQSLIDEQIGKRPALIEEAVEKLQKARSAEEKARFSQPIDLYNADLLTQRGLARALGLPGWKGYPEVTKSQAKPTDLVFREAGGYVLAIDPKTGDLVRTYGSGLAPKKDRIVQYQDARGRQHVLNLDTREDTLLPGPAEAPKKPKTFSVEAVKSANELVGRAFNGWATLPGSTDPLLQSDLWQLMKDSGAKTVGELYDEGLVDFQHMTYQETLREIQSILGPGSLSRAQQMLNRLWTRENARRLGGKVTSDGWILMPWEVEITARTPWGNIPIQKRSGRPPRSFQERQAAGGLPGGAEGAAGSYTPESRPNAPKRSNTVAYSQGDSRWASYPYGGKNLASSGCGPTTMATIISTLTGKAVTPPDVAKWAGNRYYVPGVGSSWQLFPDAAAEWGLKYQSLGKDLSAAAEVLRNGGMIVAAGSGNFFGRRTNGHILAIRGIDSKGNFYLADTAGRSGTQAFTPAEAASGLMGLFAITP